MNSSGLGRWDLQSADLGEEKEDEAAGDRQTPAVKYVSAFGAMFQGFVCVHGRLRSSRG